MHLIENNKITKKMILGSAQFGDLYGVLKNKKKLKESEVRNIIKISKKNKITYLDTADQYKSFKKILKKQNLKKWKISIKLSSKVINKQNTEAKFNNFIFKSLKSLKQKNFEYLLFHRSQDLFTLKGRKIYKYLTILKQKGFINKIGISVYSPNEIKNVIKKYKIDVIQAPYNIFDQRLNNRRLLKKLKVMNIELHARSIFLQGLLLAKKNKIPKKFLKWKNKFNSWHNFLIKNKTTALLECLNFVFSNKNIDKFIIGVNSVNNLKQIVLLKKKFIKRNFDVFKSKDINLIDPRKW